jgi:hypothetical protein
MPLYLHPIHSARPSDHGGLPLQLLLKQAFSLLPKDHVLRSWLEALDKVMADRLPRIHSLKMFYPL